MLARIVRPDEQRQPEPGHARARILWMVTMKFNPVKMELKPATKMAKPVVNYIGVHIVGGEAAW